MQIELTSIIAATATALLLTPAAQAQQRTIYGSDGRVQGRVTTDRQGSTTIYDARGRVQNRTSTDSQGTTTIYDANGRKIGSTRK